MHPTLWASRTSPVKAEAAGAGNNSSFLSLDAHGQRGLPFVKVNALQQQQHIQSLPLEPGPLGLLVDAGSAQAERDYSTMVIPVQQTDPYLNQVQINSRQQCPAPYVRDAGLWQSDSLDRLFVKESVARASEAMKAEVLSNHEDALRERSEPTFRCYRSDSDVCDDSSLDDLSPCSSKGGNFCKGEDGGISVESSQFSRPVEEQQQQMPVPLEDLQMGMGLGLAAGGRSLFPDQNYQIDLEKSRSITPRSQQDYDLSCTPTSSAYLQLIETKKDVKERGTQSIKHDDRDDVSVEDNGRGKTMKESPGAGSYFPSSLGSNFMNAGGPGPAIPPAPPYLMGGNPGIAYLQNEIPNLPPLDQVIVSHPSGASPGVQMDENLGSMGHGMMYRPAIVPAAIDIAAVVNSRPKRRNVRISSDPQSVAARHRREKISDRIRVLQMLVPGGTKMDTASMLEEAILYVKYLKKSVQAASKMANAGGGGGDYDAQHGFGSSMFLRNPAVPFRGLSGNDCSSMSQGVAAPPEQQALYGAGVPPLSYPSFADQARQQYSVCH